MNSDPNYRNLSEDLRASETLSRIVAAEAAKKISEVSDSKTLIAKLRAWIRKFWNELKATFSQWTKEDISKLTLREFKTMPFRDLIEGVDPRKYQVEGGNALAASVDAAEVEAIKAERKNIEERAKSDGTWLKAFTNAEGTRDYMFTSVTILRDDKEVVISNQEKETPRIKRLLKEGTLAYINKATLPSESTTSAQGDQSTIPGGVSYSESKDTKIIPLSQTISPKLL